MKSTSRPSSEVYKAFRKRGKFKAHLWFFYSNKNGKLLRIVGHVSFIMCVLLEADPNVAAYAVDEQVVEAIVDGELRRSEIDIFVTYADGHQAWWECKRLKDTGPGRTGRAGPQLTAQAQAALRVGMPYEVKTERDVDGKEYLFDNWLVLHASIRRAWRIAKARELGVFRERMRKFGSMTYGQLLRAPHCDPAAMAAVIALALRDGSAGAPLESSLLKTSTVITALDLLQREAA